MVCNVAHGSVLALTGRGLFGDVMIWTCSKCGYTNSWTLLRCGECGLLRPKPSHDESMPMMRQLALALTRIKWFDQHECGPGYCARVAAEALTLIPDEIKKEAQAVIDEEI